MNGKAWAPHHDKRLVEEYLKTKSVKRTLKAFPDRSYSGLLGRVKFLRTQGKLPKAPRRGRPVMFGYFISVGLGPDLRPRVEALARTRNCSMNAVLRELIELGLSHVEEPGNNG